MGKTLQAKQQAQSRIEQAAVELFLERGYRGTTVRAIAGRAAMTCGNIYFFYLLILPARRRGTLRPGAPFGRVRFLHIEPIVSISPRMSPVGIFSCSPETGFDSCSLMWGKPERVFRVHPYTSGTNL